MTSFEIPTKEQLEVTRDIFCESSQVSELVDILKSKEALGGISVSRLYTYATTSSGVDEELETKLGENLNLRRIYKDMVERTSRFHLPEAMAASSEELPSRHGQGCRIRMEASRAEADQIYVIIEIDGEADQPPSTLIVCDADQNCRRFGLPEIRNGVAQLIAERQSDLVTMLMNPKAEAYLT